MAATAPYTEGQLNRFRRLVRVAARYLFSGDLSERLQEMEAQNADENPAAAGPSKFRRKRMRENDLGIVLLDALTYHEGWISEERFAEKLSLGSKQVRKMLHLLQRQGFVAREHRREKKQGDKVQSVAEYEEAAPQARTATYVSLDYPLAFDALRLRLHLAKKAAADAIDDGKAVEQYACCSRDGAEPVCGQSYDSVGLAFLDRDTSGLFYKCSTCDFGIVAPDDPLSRQEPNGVLRIKRAKFRRDAATKQKEALLKALKPLDDMVADLAQVDPPDFGSFTDWLQRRQDLMKSGQARATTGGGSARKGKLDYGIDGPLMGQGEVDLTIDGNVADDGAASASHVIVPELEAPAAAAAANLPHFLQQAHGADTTGAAAAGTAVSAAKREDTDLGKAEQDEEQRARYEAYVRQFHAQLAAAMGVKAESDEAVKAEATADVPAATGTPAGFAEDPAAKRQRTGMSHASASSLAADQPEDLHAGADGFDWEDDKPDAATAPAAPVGQEEDDDDLDWEET